MMQGVLNVYRDNVYIVTDTKKEPLHSGQYVYLIVHGCWIPVIVRHSAETGKWCFQHLEEIEINGQEAAVK